MLLNLSYNDKEIKRQIEAELGKPFGLRERIKMRGNGSPKLILKEASEEITQLMARDKNRNVCNIEMRPNGIIIGFRSKLENYGLIVPYRKLVIFKGNSDEYTLYKDNHFFRIIAGKKDVAVHNFMKKLLEAKAAATPQNPDFGDIA
ncbi:hypothetical protein KIV10_04315 [Aequorivita echinoideorum]|uniref:Uncharacterized protein n=2 Tax=Aequorivita echinoideorum TaxID=1549647 RepID=A0ABS5S2F7_9FLAO|nr:hypothetical protein [Aequorivita echinoideorum]